MNKPFEVCLLLVLLGRVLRDRGRKGKGRRQTGIEVQLIAICQRQSATSYTVLITLRGTNRNKMKGIIGKKIGMTSIFNPDGKQTACTIIEAGPCVVTQVKTKETDGYNALQLAFGDKKEKHSISC